MSDKPTVGRVAFGPVSKKQMADTITRLATRKCERCDRLRGLLRECVAAVELARCVTGTAKEHRDKWSDLLQRIEEGLSNE